MAKSPSRRASRGGQLRTYRERAQELIDVTRLRGFERDAPARRHCPGLDLAPLLLLMDEPFGALDAQTRLNMQELLLAAHDRNYATVLFVTHHVGRRCYSPILSQS